MDVDNGPFMLNIQCYSFTAPERDRFSLREMWTSSKIKSDFKRNHGIDFDTYEDRIYSVDPDPNGRGKLDCDFSHKSYGGAKIINDLMSKGFIDPDIEFMWKKDEFKFHRWHHQVSLYYYDKSLTRG